MAGFFSFRRLITPSFIKAIYVIGFLLLTAGGIAFSAWAGWRLNEATISRELGWRYVAYGVAVLIFGNLLWRIVCEFWIVIFNLHDELVVVRETMIPNQFYVAEETAEIQPPSEPMVLQTPREESFDTAHQTHRAGILGLS